MGILYSKIKVFYTQLLMIKGLVSTSVCGRGIIYSSKN